ncbi:uncharacterized protein LOC128669715 [Plodia interpunctella]|uniref:uncharacterized protein LOC128669715 n=1 Tax=Plodia interpunctella TaxID=58824 RepID=UPI0031015357
MKVVFLVLCALSVYGETPDYFPKCKRNDPQIEKCILDGVEAIRPHLKKGIPEVNIPAVDPFIVPTLKLDRTAPNLRLKATIRQAKAYGGSAFKIEKLRINLNNKYAAELKVTIPKLMVVADYDVHGSRLLTLDINGKGRVRGNFTGIAVVAKGMAKLVPKDNVEYLQADKVVAKVRINHAQVAVEDSERPVAATSAAAFFNASPGVVLDILSPLIEETSAAVAKAFINKILGSIPIKDVLLDDRHVLNHIYTKTWQRSLHLLVISKMWKLLFLLASVHAVCAGVGKSFINFGGFVCPREDRALGRCLRDALNAYIPKLATGVPEYGIPPSEPLVVPSLSVQQSSGPISVWSSYTDVTVRGPSTMRIKDVKVYSDEHKVVANIYIPELRMKGNYELSGNLLMLPIKGDGKFSAKYGDIDAIVTISLGRARRLNDVDALSCEDLHVKFHLGYASMQLQNLFGGDDELGNTMNSFLNENWQKLAEELKAPMEEALRDFLKPLADHAFATLNADDILQ